MQVSSRLILRLSRLKFAFLAVRSVGCGCQAGSGRAGRWSALRRGPLVSCCAGARERRGPACTDVLPADSSTFPANVCTFWP